MTNETGSTTTGGDGRAGGAGDAGDAQTSLTALLGDLTELREYLTQRGQQTYAIAQRCMESARRNPESRAYDERQAVIADYQHYIWHEIAGLVNKLLVTYGDVGTGADAADDVRQNDGED